MSDLINGLRHMADDHPCCEPTIIHVIDALEKLERENAALKIERNRYKIALEDIAEASGEWAGDRARGALGKEAQP